MKVLHVSENSNGIEEVTLLANRVSERNQLHAIERDGEVFYTGGFIFPDTGEIRSIFNVFAPPAHYELAKLLKVDPFEKLYFEK